MPPLPRSRRCRGSDITDNSNLSRDGAALSSSVIPETSVFGIVGRAGAQRADGLCGFRIEKDVPYVAYIRVHIILHARRRKSTCGGMPTKADAAARRNRGQSTGCRAPRSPRRLSTDYLLHQCTATPWVWTWCFAPGKVDQWWAVPCMIGHGPVHGAEDGRVARYSVCSNRRLCKPSRQNWRSSPSESQMHRSLADCAPSCAAGAADGAARSRLGSISEIERRLPLSTSGGRGPCADFGLNVT